MVAVVVLVVVIVIVILVIVIAIVVVVAVVVVVVIFVVVLVVVVVDPRRANGNAAWFVRVCRRPPLEARTSHRSSREDHRELSKQDSCQQMDAPLDYKLREASAVAPS